MSERAVISQSPEHTRSLAEQLADALQPGDVLCLIGNLGAGKTAFAQGLADALGSTTDHSARSPTFALASEYPNGRLELTHIDAYRLENEEAWIRSGFDEYFERGGVCVIEWADRALGVMPLDRLEIRFETLPDPQMRQISFLAFTERWESVLPMLGHSREPTL